MNLKLPRVMVFAAVTLLAAASSCTGATAGMPASAQPRPVLTNPHPCPGAAGFTCSTLTVPLDHSGHTPGRLGLQVAAYRHGQLVIDAWAGVADSASAQPVDGQSLFWASSTGKGIAATCVHVLAERGQLD